MTECRVLRRCVQSQLSKTTTALFKVTWKKAVVPVRTTLMRCPRFNAIPPRVCFQPALDRSVRETTSHLVCTCLSQPCPPTPPHPTPPSLCPSWSETQVKARAGARIPRLAQSQVKKTPPLFNVIWTKKTNERMPCSTPVCSKSVEQDHNRFFSK